MNNDLWARIEKAGPLPADAPLEVRMHEFSRRDAFTKEFGWAVPSREVIAEIAAFADGDEVLEIGAGLGLWSHLLQTAGARMLTTDPFAEGRMTDIRHPFRIMRGAPTWTGIDRFWAGDVGDYGLQCARTLLTVWPSYDEPWANDALTKFAGDRVVYVGEGEGGCTADDGFHETLAQHWDLEKTSDIPQWFGIHDYVFFYRRKTPVQKPTPTTPEKRPRNRGLKLLPISTKSAY